MSARPDQIKCAIEPLEFYRRELEQAPDLKPSADGWTQNVLCPFHDEADPSFGINAHTGGFRCFGCDAQGGSILDFAMRRDRLTLDQARADLTERYRVEPAEAPTNAHHGAPEPADPEPKATPAPLPPVPAEALATRPKAHPQHGAHSGLWVYRDAAGNPLAFVLRFDPEGARKLFAPQTWTKAGGWQWKAPPVPRPLYHLDQLTAHPTAPVLFTEGEKAANAAARLLPDLVTTTTMNGAQSPAKSDLSPLTGRTVRIWPDHDKPGADYARKVAALAHAAGAVAVEVLDLDSLKADPKTGEPRDLPPGWDAADAAADGWTPAALATAARWVAIPAAAPDRPTKAAVTLVRADSIKPEPIAWLWGGWLAQGKVHVMAGAPGTGKTTLAVALAATLTIGGRWPDGAPAPVGDVLIWSGEDDPTDTLAPRLIAAGADLRRGHFVTGCTDERGPRAFDPATDTTALSDHLATMDPAPVLLIVDPIVSAIAGDSHKNAEVRRSLQPLVDLAQVRRVAILGVSHFSKGTQGRDPTERVTGSLAFGALARVVLATAKLPDADGGGRILVRAKSNLGIDSGGFRYDLAPVELPAHPGIFTTAVLWGDALEGTARELLSRADAQGPGDDEDGSTADIEAFVRGCLASGPATAKQMQADTNGAGYSWDKVKRTAQRIGVDRRKKGFKSGWVWELRREQEAEDESEGSEESTLRSAPPSHSSGPCALPDEADQARAEVEL